MATTKARQDLRSKFVRNAIPTEQDFKDLIDAQLNQKDDGIFRSNPAEPLSIVAGSDPQKRSLRFYSDDTGGAPDWLISLNPGQDPNDAATNRRGFGIANGTGATRLFLDSAGNVGIGTTTPDDRLDVDGRVRAGALTIGPWPANPANYAFIGSNLQDQTQAGNYALLVGTGAEVGTTCLNGSASIGLRIANAQHVTVTTQGNVGIGTTTPDDRLDVDGRVRAGALTIGPWPANPANYAFIGSNLQDQTQAGNYALLVGTGAEVGTTYVNGSASIGLRIGNAQRATVNGQGIAVNGNLKITGNSEIDGNFKTTGNGDINGSLTIGTTTSALFFRVVPNTPSGTQITPGAGTIRIGDWLLRTNGNVFEIVHAPPARQNFGIGIGGGLGTLNLDKIVARFDASQAGAGRLSFP